MRRIQEKIRKFCNKNNLQGTPEIKILDTLSELGELAKEILKATDYGKKKMVGSDGLKSELGDVFFSLISAANSLNLDLEESLEAALRKYDKRLRKGGAGSENEI